MPAAGAVATEWWPIRVHHPKAVILLSVTSSASRISQKDVEQKDVEQKGFLRGVPNVTLCRRQCTSPVTICKRLAIKTPMGPWRSADIGGSTNRCSALWLL
jgi:hypothetical protein